MHEAGGEIETSGKRVIGVQRKNDRNLMEDLDSFSETQRIQIQQCRLYLCVQTLSDVCNAAGDRMIKEFYDGKRYRDSTLQWPNQEKKTLACMGAMETTTANLCTGQV